MTSPPGRPKIYHITHVDNLGSMVAAGRLISDAAMIAKGGPTTAIGMSNIKKRRLALPVSCHPGDHVGDFVPFYFCPRSIMLYVIYRGNHPALTYRGGQEPIVHLEADLHNVAAWADQNARRWAFSLSNASAFYRPTFSSDLADLGQVDWAAIAATDFRDATVKESKQAEFLVHQDFPWELVTRIGVYSRSMATTVATALASTAHQPRIEIRTDWYY
jgi:hypothetical protein